MRCRAIFAVLLLIAGGCGVSGRNALTNDTAPRAEALSLVGEPLFAPTIAPETRVRMEE